MQVIVNRSLDMINDELIGKFVIVTDNNRNKNGILMESENPARGNWTRYLNTALIYTNIETALTKVKTYHYNNPRIAVITNINDCRANSVSNPYITVELLELH